MARREEGCTFRKTGPLGQLKNWVNWFVTERLNDGYLFVPLMALRRFTGDESPVVLNDTGSVCEVASLP
jgi:hypothetical protein